MIKIKNLKLVISIDDREIRPLEFEKLLIKEGVSFVPICEIYLKLRDFSFVGLKAGKKINIKYALFDKPFKELQFITNNVTITNFSVKDIEVIISGILDLEKFYTEIKQEFFKDKTTKEVIASFKNLEKVIYDSKYTPKDKQIWIRYNLSEFSLLKSIIPYINFMDYDKDTPLITLDIMKNLKVIAIKEKLKQNPKAIFYFNKSTLSENEYQIQDFKYETDNAYKFLLPKNSFIKIYDYLTKKGIKQKLKTDSEFEVKQLKNTHIWLGNTYKDYWKVRVHNISNWINFFSESIIFTVSQKWIDEEQLGLLDNIKLNLSSFPFTDLDKLSTNWITTQKHIIINSDSTIYYKMVANRIREEDWKYV